VDPRLRREGKKESGCKHLALKDEGEHKNGA
jgi:hypothetical protein